MPAPTSSDPHRKEGAALQNSSLRRQKGSADRHHNNPQPTVEGSDSEALVEGQQLSLFCLSAQPMKPGGRRRLSRTKPGVIMTAGLDLERPTWQD